MDKNLIFLINWRLDHILYHKKLNLHLQEVYSYLYQHLFVFSNKISCISSPTIAHEIISDLASLGSGIRFFSGVKTSISIAILLKFGIQTGL